MPRAGADPVDDKRAQAAAVSAKLADQARAILGLDKEHRQAEERLGQAQSAMLQAATELGAAQQRQEEARLRLVAHAQLAYVAGGSISLVGRMAKGEGDDVVARGAYLRMVHGEDRLAIGRLRSTREDLQLRHASLVDAQRRAVDQAGAVTRDLTALQRAVGSQEALYKQVTGELATLVAAEQRKAAEADAARRAAQARARPVASSPTTSVPLLGSALSMDEAFACIRQLESGSNYAHPNGGAYQFLDATWQSLGYDGAAEDHPPAVQDQAARQLQARSGWGQWAVAPRCGLI